MTGEVKPRGTWVRKGREEVERTMSEITGVNEQLRLMVAALESDRSELQFKMVHLHEQLMQVRENLAQRVDDHNTLLRRVTELRRDSEAIVRRFSAIETQNASLANLYVVCCQLHSSLDRREVLAAIREIVVNHIGSEGFAIYERRGENRLRLVESSEGAPALREVAFGEGVIGKAAASGEAFLSNADSPAEVTW